MTTQGIISELFFKVYGLDDDFRLCGLEFHYEIAVNENYSVL